MKIEYKTAAEYTSRLRRKPYALYTGIIDEFFKGGSDAALITFSKGENENSIYYALKNASNRRKNYGVTVHKEKNENEEAEIWLIRKEALKLKYQEGNT